MTDQQRKLTIELLIQARDLFKSQTTLYDPEMLLCWMARVADLIDDLQVEEAGAE